MDAGFIPRRPAALFGKNTTACSLPLLCRRGVEDGTTLWSDVHSLAVRIVPVVTVMQTGRATSQLRLHFQGDAIRIQGPTALSYHVCEDGALKGSSLLRSLGMLTAQST